MKKAYWLFLGVVIFIYILLVSVLVIAELTSPPFIAPEIDPEIRERAKQEAKQLR